MVKKASHLSSMLLDDNINYSWCLSSLGFSVLKYWPLQNQISVRATKFVMLVPWQYPSPLRQCFLSSPQLRRYLGDASKAWIHVLSFQVLNILSSDSYSLFEAALFCPLPATIPILMAVCAVYAFFILGPTALIGISVYIIFIPIQVMAGLCNCNCCMLAFCTHVFTELDRRFHFQGRELKPVPPLCAPKCAFFCWQSVFFFKNLNLNALGEGGMLFSLSKSPTFSLHPSNSCICITCLIPSGVPWSTLAATTYGKDGWESQSSFP